MMAKTNLDIAIESNMTKYDRTDMIKQHGENYLCKNSFGI